MEYQLQQTGQEVQDRLNQIPTTEENLQNEITRSTNKDNELETAIENEQTRAEGVESGLQTAIDNEVSRAEGVEGNLQTSITNEKNRAEGVEGGLRTDVDAIEGKIPTGASDQNKLATEGFVNSSISTNTADFKGTYNSIEELQTEVPTATANDYAFVISTDASGNTVYNRYKYVAGEGWQFEYALNNSSFTAAQWSAINSAITAALVAKLNGLPTAAELTQRLNAIIDSVDTEKTRAEGIEAVLRTDVNTNAAAIVTEKNRAQGVEGTLTNGLNAEILARQNADTALQQNINAEALLRDNADDALQAEIDEINAKIPTQASASNQLADKAFVNSSIATNTGEFKGTYNSLAELQAVTNVNANDYGFVIATDGTGNTVYNRYKYVTGQGWVFEYALNNSSFTAAQWGAINSGITAALAAKINGLPDIDALNAMFAAITSKIPANASSSNKLVDYAQLVAALAAKQDNLIFDNAPTENSNNPVKSGGVYSAIATVTAAIVGLQSSKQDVLTFDQYPTPGSNNPVRSTGIYSSIENAVAPKANQTDLDNAVIRISTNEVDIAQLQAAYRGLTQNDVVPVAPTDTWPVANPQENVIYRVADRTNTPPQYYTDYMWNGTVMVLMAQYNNAIDSRPKKNSQNLVTSGGVFDNMGALDVSELNATENPHTPAIYADLSAALAAIQTDYQKGGMSIKFIQGTVQSSDNKYVQYRLMSDMFNTTPSNWQGVDHKPASGSKNLLESGGAFDDIYQLGAKQDMFLPATIMSINPSICSNTGKYIGTDKEVHTHNSYGYSDVIHVLPGQKIVITGVGSNIPYIVYCTSDGTVTSTSASSTGIDSIFNKLFEEETYIKINGRIVYDNVGVISGIICNYAMPLGDFENLINNGFKKLIATRGSIYIKNENSVDITLNTIFVQDINGEQSLTIEDTNTYSIGPRGYYYLVLKEDNTIDLKQTSANILASDIVLLFYDLDKRDISGGILYADYLHTRINSLKAFSGFINVNAYASHQAAYSDRESARLAVLPKHRVKGAKLIYLVNDNGTNVWHSEINLGSNLDDNSWKREQFWTSEFTDLKKYVSARGAVYNKSGYSITVKLNTIFVYDANKQSATEINDTNNYVLSSNGRYLVLQANNTITLRPSSVQVQSSDLILLYYDDNIASKDIKGGALYADYLASISSNLASISSNLATAINNVNANVKKYVSTRGAVYTKNTYNVRVTLNTLFVYDVDGASATTISDNTEYTLKASARYLVLQANNTLATRISSSAVLKSDFILLYYDDDAKSKDIKSGALYADYLSYQLAHVPTDDSIKVVPSNFGQINCIRKAYQMAKVKWTPKIANTIPYNSGTFPVTQQQGMIYSSVKEYSQFAFEDVSLETFMTAVNNPRSVLYTENVSAANSQSEIGRTYHGINCAAYYGSVCSGLLIYAYGLPVNITTFEFRYWDRMEIIQDQTAYGLEIGDAIWQNGHIQLVTGITKNNNGFVTDVEVVENAAATTKIKHYTANSLQAYITANSCVLLRYKDLYTNRNYVPLTDFVAVMDETQGSYTYNDDICLDYGEKSNYNVGDSVVLNLRTDYASEGFTTLEVYKNEVLLISRAIAGQDEILTGLAYGDYKARIVGDNSLASEFVHFKVVDVQVTKSGDSFTFSSANGTPVYYEFCDITGERDHDAGEHGLTTKQFTAEEITAGQATPSGNVVPSASFPYLKVHFSTDYGRVIKIINWYN